MTDIVDGEILPANKGGRPTKYEDWMPEKMVQLAQEGYFIYEIAVDFELTHKTLWLWSKDASKPEFCKAYAKTADIIIAKLLRDLYDNRMTKFYNPKCIEMILQHMAGAQERRALTLPGFAQADYTEKLQQIFTAAELGRIRPDELKVLVDTLKTAFEILHGEETLNRLALLEDKTKEIK